MTDVIKMRGFSINLALLNVEKKRYHKFVKGVLYTVTCTDLKFLLKYTHLFLMYMSMLGLKLEYIGGLYPSQEELYGF